MRLYTFKYNFNISWTSLKTVNIYFRLYFIHTILAM